MDGILDLLFSAISLMLLGMGFVFVFLGLMVVVTGALAKLAPMAATRPVAAPAGGRQALDPKLMAAIAAAVHRYRTR